MFDQFNNRAYTDFLRKPYVTRCSHGEVRTYRKRIYKTFDRELAEYLIKNKGFELLATTTTKKRPYPKYTLWGVHERLSGPQMEAIKNKVLKECSYIDNDEELVRLRKEAKVYV